MKKFPRFLKVLPSIYGLSFYEIGGLVAALYIAMIFKLSSIMTLGISLGFMGFLRFSRKNFDFIGYFTPSVKRIDLTKFKGDKK